ncbi:late endosomal/lysosomal adaptor and MAPK and MTOR activator domain-containing protein [Hirsutella rhossiliensis]|uniref:Late endosomal/lysosomal adaptor and MAPK and MTOR activator domain-containing protein n=1 Tax=Hirsutella rhossiliensis TaxID=111463 RepID=A0A9P8SDB5_9HYPO|nr:late endosomal/lysosomal adaptor and MAPK and MTOR activator domain-containing protein [Hirsutella rhossiliensis]KAH0958548.1 late endosomal/lysosomal adaptor and MAPK and MTOR activator domain-containing protein [Hirsutella rhossiliensis]
MGACASCLGRRGKDAYDESEESRLLYEDGNGMAYGSFGDPAMGGDDTLEAQREAEALQRVVAKTSNNMVDVFEIAPHDMLTRAGANPTPFAYAGQGSRVARYQHLVSKLNADHDGDAAGVRVDWLADDDGAADALDSQSNRPASIKTLSEDNGGDTLVGTFADAAAAMQ